MHCRDAVSRQLTNGGGSREFTVSEYWLSEHQAVYLTTQSGTNKAKVLTAEVVKVFVAARRGQLANLGELGKDPVIALRDERLRQNSDRSMELSGVSQAGARSGYS